jgi:hypothetical protein
MQRITSFDLARGFTVLIMPAAHALLLYGQPEVHQTLLADIFRFLAEGPGAQLFMLLMGVSLTFSKRITMRYVFKRALLLLSAAYLLNFFKFIVPLGLGILPENLLTEFQLINDIQALDFFFFMGDILHFAAIAYLLLYLVTRLKHYAIWAFILTVAIMILSPFVWDVKTGFVFVDSIIILFNGHPPQTFFPVFPWIVYPLMGLTIGFLLKHNNADWLLKKTGLSGLGLIIISWCFPPTTTITPWPPFYRTEPADTLFHLGFVLLWLSGIHWISRKVKENYFFRLLKFCSKQITTIYIIQWILICWCMALTGYMQLDIITTVGWMCGATVITLLLTYAITRSYAQSKNI